MTYLAATLLLSLLTSTGSAMPQRYDAACSKERTKRVVTSFVRAYNRGDLARLERLWAQEPDFQWYFVDDEREQDAEDRVNLPLYFDERARLGDHLELRRLSVNENGTDFAFKLRRTTDDERAGAEGLFHGKGAARDVLALPTPEDPIPTQKCLLIVWAMDT